VIAIAAGLESGIGHAFDSLDQPFAIMLGGGAALYLFSEAMFRRVLGLGFVEGRLAAALFAAATIPLGTEVAAVLQMAALVAIFGVMVGVQERAVARA
jgi:low temperature requirement protein LtrA